MYILVKADKVEASRRELTKWGASRIGTDIKVPCKMPSAEFMARIAEGK